MWQKKIKKYNKKAIIIMVGQHKREMGEKERNEGRERKRDKDAC